MRTPINALLPLLLSACIAAGSDRIEGRAQSAVVSLEPQAWLVEQLAGERVEVTALLPPGADPETYQPSDAEVSRLFRAGIYFRIGVPFERGPWFRAVRSTGRLEIVDVRRDVPLRRMDDLHGDHHGPQSAGGHRAGDDPHIWLSPRLLALQARTVTRALAASDPEGAELYRLRLAVLEEELTTLDAELRQLLAPFAGRSFLVFHPSWGYFADEYDLRQVAIEVEGKEPGDRELTELQQAARKAGMTTVFVQPQVTGRAAAAVASALGGRVETIDPLARDVPANLRRVAGKLVEACRGSR